VAAAAQQRELQKATEEYEQKKARVEEHNRVMSDILAKVQRQEDEMRQNHRDSLRAVTDQKLRQDLQDKHDAEERKAQQQNKETEQKLQEELAKLKAEAEKAKSAQQTIIQQPPPVIYYPPYNWRYYYYW
jgi:hypothetical protein